MEDGEICRNFYHSTNINYNNLINKEAVDMQRSEILSRKSMGVIASWKSELKTHYNLKDMLILPTLIKFRQFFKKLTGLSIQT
jgi:hypothetical protein